MNIGSEKTLKDPKNLYLSSDKKEINLNNQNNNNKLKNLEKTNNGINQNQTESKQTNLTTQADTEANTIQNKTSNEDLIILPKNLSIGFNNHIKKFFTSDEKYINESTQKPHLFSFLNGTNKGNFHKHRSNYPIPYFIEPAELHRT